MRGPVENFQKRLPLGIPKRDSCGRNLPVFPALKLNVETLISTPDQSPPNDVDVLDDDYWFHEIFRAPKLSGNLRPTHLPSTSGGPMPNRKNGGRNGWNVSGDSGNWCSRRTKPAIPESGKKWMRWCSVRRRREPHQRRYKPPPLPGSASVPCARVLAKSEEPPPRKKRPRAHDQWRGNPTAAPPAATPTASTAAFPASPAVEGATLASARSPPARSGSERPRLPPQVGPQPTHPVRQNATWHSEVDGDIGVSPAVYDSVLQQPAVVVGQIPKEGAKSVRGIVHRGDLGGQDDTPGQAGFPGVLFLPSGRFGPRHTWEYVQDQRKASEVPRLGISSVGLTFRIGDGDSLESWLTGSGDLSPLGSRRGCGSICPRSLLRPRGQRRCGRRCATKRRSSGVRHDNRHTLVTELSESGRWRRSDLEHRRPRFSRHAFAILECADGSEAETAATRSLQGSAAADEKRKDDAERQQKKASEVAVWQSAVVH